MNNVIRLLFAATLLLAWEYASGRIIPVFFISKPSIIWETLYLWLSSGQLLFHGSITALEAVAGFLLGGFTGTVAGIVLGRARRLGEILEPFLIVFYSLPKVALAPLFVLWFGIGIDMKIILTATIVFFLVFLNTYTGVRNVSTELITILRLMGASERHLITKVVGPAAMTWVFTGLRLSVPYALIGAIVGELIASNRGLGYLLSSAAGQFQTGGVFAALAAIAALAICLQWIVIRIEMLLVPWQRRDKGQETAL